MTSASHLAMCHTVPWLVPFTRQCVIRYHDQCLSPGNVSYATMTSVYHLAMCHTVPWLVLFTCQYVIRYHNQCNMTMRHTVPRPVQHDNAPYGNTTSVFHLVICHTVPRPASFTLQCVIRYHDQRLSYGTKVKVWLQVLTKCTFSVTWDRSVIFYGYSFWKTTLIFFKSENKNGNLYKTRECYRC